VLNPLSTLSRVALMASGASALALSTPSAGGEEGHLLHPGLLVISSSRHEQSQGAVASLKVGSTLPSSATATTVDNCNRQFGDRQDCEQHDHH
jgi:hypothetical protein